MNVTENTHKNDHRMHSHVHSFKKLCRNSENKAIEILLISFSLFLRA